MALRGQLTLRAQGGWMECVFSVDELVGAGCSVGVHLPEVFCCRLHRRFTSAIPSLHHIFPPLPTPSNRNLSTGVERCRSDASVGPGDAELFVGSNARAIGVCVCLCGLGGGGSGLGSPQHQRCLLPLGLIRSWIFAKGGHVCLSSKASRVPERVSYRQAFQGLGFRV